MLSTGIANVCFFFISLSLYSLSTKKKSPKTQLRSKGFVYLLRMGIGRRYHHLSTGAGLVLGLVALVAGLGGELKFPHHHHHLQVLMLLAAPV